MAAIIAVFEFPPANQQNQPTLTSQWFNEQDIYLFIYLFIDLDPFYRLIFALAPMCVAYEYLHWLPCK